MQRLRGTKRSRPALAPKSADRDGDGKLGIGDVLTGIGGQKLRGGDSTSAQGALGGQGLAQ